MKGSEKPVEEIAAELVDRILEERQFNKPALVPVVAAFIRVFVKYQSAPKFKLSDLSEESIIKHKIAADKYNKQATYWRTQIRKYCTDEEMQAHYDNCNKII